VELWFAFYYCLNSMHRSMSPGQTAWLNVMVGNAHCVDEARKVDLKTLVCNIKDKSLVDVEQIDLDLKRNLGTSREQIPPVRTVLISWTVLNSGIGYSQGMDTICIVLYNHFCNSNSPQPENDTLGALGFVLRVNAGYLPLHMHDKAPLDNAALFATEMWLEVGSTHPQLRGKILLALELFEIFALQHLSVCFANLFDKDAIQLVWEYLFRDQGGQWSRAEILNLSARRCRHLVSASVLHHKKLWLYGEDERQNFQIWENLLRISDFDSVKSIIDIALFLERVETLGGAAQ